LLNRRLASVTQRSSHASVELTYAEWLGHIIISAQIKRRHLAVFVRYAREHHDWEISVSPSHCSQELQSIHVRKSEIEQNYVGSVRKKLKCTLSVVGCPHLEATRDQLLLQEPEQASLVLNNEHLNRATGSLSRCVPGGFGAQLSGFESFA